MYGVPSRLAQAQEDCNLPAIPRKIYHLFNLETGKPLIRTDWRTSSDLRFLHLPLELEVSCTRRSRIPPRVGGPPPASVPGSGPIAAPSTRAVRSRRSPPPRPRSSSGGRSGSRDRLAFAIGDAPTDRHAAMVQGAGPRRSPTPTPGPAGSKSLHGQAWRPPVASPATRGAASHARRRSRGPSSAPRTSRASRPRRRSASPSSTSSPGEMVARMRPRPASGAEPAWIVAGRGPARGACLEPAWRGPRRGGAAPQGRGAIEPAGRAAAGGGAPRGSAADLRHEGGGPGEAGRSVRGRAGCPSRRRRVGPCSSGSSPDPDGRASAARGRCRGPPTSDDVGTFTPAGPAAAGGRRGPRGVRDHQRRDRRPRRSASSGLEVGRRPREPTGRPRRGRPGCLAPRRSGPGRPGAERLGVVRDQPGGDDVPRQQCPGRRRRRPGDLGPHRGEWRGVGAPAEASSSPQVGATHAAWATAARSPGPSGRPGASRAARGGVRADASPPRARAGSPSGRSPSPTNFRAGRLASIRRLLRAQSAARYSPPAAPGSRFRRSAGREAGASNAVGPAGAIGVLGGGPPSRWRRPGRGARSARPRPKSVLD